MTRQTTPPITRQVTRSRLGWLGPALVAVGAAVGLLGGWYMIHARPSAGAVIDTIAIEGRRAIVVRAESGGERAFVELRDGDQVIWQALVPRYAGRPGAPGLAWSTTAVSIRVIRDARAELFALAMRDGTKLGGMQLAPQHGPVIQEPDGPVTLTDHLRSYEIVAGPGWHQLVATDLLTGHGLWARELGPLPVRAGGVADGAVWIDQGAGPQAFAATTGEPHGGPAPSPPDHRIPL